MKVKVFVMFFLFLSFFQGIICSANSQNGQNDSSIRLTADEEAWLRNHKTIQVAGPAAFPPFQYLSENGTPMGLAVDYTRFISKRLGIDIRIQKGLPWPEVLKKIKNRQIDALSCAAKTHKRETYMSFTQSYLSFPIVVVARKNTPFIGGLNDLNGKKIACVAKTSICEWLEQDRIEFVSHKAETPLEALQAVSIGTADIHIENLAAAGYLIEKNGLANLKIAGSTDYDSYDLYFAVRSDYPEFVNILNKAISAITPEEHQQIRRKWLFIKYEEKIDWQFIIPWILASVFTVAVTLLWNRRLAKEIYRRKQITEYLKKSEEKYKAAKEAAETANRTKSVFLANMSHEIRTPMNSVIGYLSLVLEDSSISKKHRDYLETAHKSSKALMGLINDILSVSKLESGRLKMEKIPLNLHTMMQEIIRTLDIAVKNKGLSLELKIDTRVPENIIGDPDKLKQILINLIGNAVKFTEKGRIAITVEPANENSTLHFIINDSGIGIPADRLDKIFEPFTQADGSTARRFGGTGLGTTISRQLAELMGGKIRVESKEGKGSTFCLTIPAEPTDTIPLDGQAQSRDLKGSRRFRVLTAEDIEENIILVKIRLEEQGHTVIEARNGYEAVLAFARETPDIILMDVHMPEMDGIQAARQIRKQEAGSGNRIPIIALTASVMKEDQQICLQADMDAIVGKPIDFDELFGTMEKLIPACKNRPNADLQNFTGTYPELPELKGVDTKKGLSIWKNAEVYKKALAGFCNNYENAGEKIKEFLTNEDREAAYRIIHALRGVAGNLSVTEVSSIAANLSVKIRERPACELVPLIESFTSALDSVVASVRLLETEKQDRKIVKKELDMPYLREVFQDMIASFEEYTPSATEPFLEELGCYLSSQQIEPIKEKLNEFDFDRARDETVKLAQALGIMQDAFLTE
ncbi:MAG: transporter substrate-binding domain-containing protein [Desulfobacterales bacterium]|nr:transporter substrate-binding domain-containing protein [Desulfobacterales bacterium]